MAVQLPRIFRRTPFPLTPPFVEGDHPLGNILIPGARSFAEDVPPPAQIAAPNLTNIATALPQPVDNPNVDVDAPPLLGLQPPPPAMIQGDKYSRPQNVIGATSPEEAAMMRNQALHAYEPQKSKGFWDRFLKPALLGGGLGFIAGGPGGAIGGAATNAIRSAFNPKAPNEDWKRRETAQSDREVTGMLQRQKMSDEDVQRQATLQRTIADTQLSRRRAAELGKSKPRNVQTGTAVLPDGRSVQVERDDKGTWQLSKGADGDVVVKKAAPNAKSKVTVDVPGVGPLEVTPESALGYYSTAENRQQTSENKAGEAEFSNTQLQSNISDAAGEQAKVEQALKDTAPTVTTTDETTGTQKTVRNPIYTDLENRRDKLIDDQRRWKGELKAVPKTNVTRGRAKIQPKVSAGRLKSEFGIK